MPRQRLSIADGVLTRLGQRVTGLVGLMMIYCGAVSLALAAGSSSADVQRFSGYRGVFDALGGLDPTRWSSAVRIAIVVGGVVALVMLVALGWAQRLVPHRARSQVELEGISRGSTTVAPRAVERAAEIAASQEPGVQAVRARLGEGEITLNLQTSTADGIPDLLRAAQRRATTALSESGTPQPTVRVTVTRYSPPSTKEQLR